MSEKIVLGLIEKVRLYGEGDEYIDIDARIDTGAQNSSIDQSLAAQLKLGPILKSKAIRQSNGRTVRPVVEVKLDLEGKEIQAEFTISDRSHMTYRALIGQNILKQGFIIDPVKYE